MKIKHVVLLTIMTLVIAGCGNKAHETAEEVNDIFGNIYTGQETDNSGGDSTSALAEKVNDSFAGIKTDIDIDMSAFDNFTASVKKKNLWGTGIMVNGQWFRMVEKKLNDLIADGWTSRVDMTANQVEPCKVTDEVELKWSGAADAVSVYARVVNIHDIAEPLGECYVASVRILSNDVNIENNYHMIFGASTINDFEENYKEEDIYIDNSTIVINDIPNNYIITDIDFHRIISLGTNTVNEKYVFSNGVMSEMYIEVPNLLYGGIADNVKTEDRDKLEVNDDAYYDIAKKKTEMIDSMKKEYEKLGADVEISESSGQITLPSIVLFDTDSYEVKADGKAFIDEVMGIYLSMILDDKYRDFVSGIMIEGHTDSSGSYDYNMTLSEKRAMAVYNYLLASEGITDNIKADLPQMCEIYGRSYDDPVFDMNGNEDMAASRRVTIKFLIRF